MSPLAETTIAEIKKYAEAAGVVLAEVPAAIVKDRNGFGGSEHLGHYLVSGERYYHIESFLTAIRQRSYQAIELRAANVGCYEFAIPGGAIKLVYHEAMPGDKPLQAMMSFTPETEP